ncbi:MAG TPA: hypothetical protein PLY78_08980, partial [Methanospirillum sp.]|nr:hypothetical protein [Methanospirillum sp.]
MNRHEGTILILLVAGIPGSILIGYIFHENVSGQIPDNTSAGREVSLSQQGFIQPSLLVPLSHSSFLVSDLNNKALLLVQENGTIQRIITREVAQPYGYWDIAGIAQDSQGNIYLSDRSTHRILKLSGTGSLSTSWGGFGEGEGQFDSPSGIGIVNGSGKELVYVCDTGNARIEVFTQQGIYQYSFQIPSDEQKNIRIVRPKEQKTSVDIQKFKVIPQKGANPAFVKRTFTIQSSGSALDMIFSVNRSVYLGAQKISFQSSDISTRNPEEWVPVVSAIL